MYELEILNLYRQCGICSFPIDCFEIIRKIGYSVKTYGEIAQNREELKILMSFSPDAFTHRGKKIIFYNDKAYGKRIRFSLMHEVGHIITGSDDEDIADTFSAASLAPLAIVKKSMPISVDGICRKFDVSVSVANRIIKDVKKYSLQTNGALELIEHFRKPVIVKKKIQKSISEVYFDIPVAEFNEMMLIKHDRDLYFY